MPDAPAAVPAHQLIYTNVEADLSPNRQRGFQVWLASPELTPEQRRATAKRLDDFRLPPGVAGPAAVLARHVFFHLADSGYFVVARTVPSAERDKFGRGGKFHAHAVLVKEDAFRSLGSNPFRIIDGGFAFHEAPADAMKAGNWRSGSLPTVELAPGEPAADRIALPAERLVELLEHLERTDEKPLVIADRPERMLAALRTCFAELPPSARRKLEFDTLSTGAALAQIRYAAAGAYSATHLKMWSFRRYHQLDLGTGTCTPPIAPTDGVRTGELLRTAGWNELADGDRDAALAMAKTMARGELDEIGTLMLTPQVLAVVAASPGFAGAVDAAVRARIERDVSPGLAALPGMLDDVRSHFAGAPGEVLERLQQPVPREWIAHALYESLKSVATELPHDVHAALGVWLAAGHPPPRLELIFRRWRGTDGDFGKIQRALSEPEEDSKRHKWFRDWLEATLPEGTAEELVSRLAPDSEPTAAALRDTRLWLALNPEPTPVATELRLLASLHRGPDVLAAALTGARRIPNADGWLVRVISSRLRDSFKPGWMNDGPDGLHFGLYLMPHRATDETLLEAAIALGSSLARRVLFALWPVSLKPSSPSPSDSVEPSPPPLAKEYDDLQKADVNALAEKTARLRSELLQSDDEAFRWAGNQLLRKVYGGPVLQAVSEDVYFVGLKLAWVQFDKPSHQLATFEAVAGAVVGEFSPDRVTDVGRALELRPTRRFSWMLARLTDPNGTERLPVV